MQSADDYSWSSHDQDEFLAAYETIINDIHLSHESFFSPAKIIEWYTIIFNMCNTKLQLFYSLSGLASIYDITDTSQWSTLQKRVFCTVFKPIVTGYNYLDSRPRVNPNFRLDDANTSIAFDYFVTMFKTIT